MGPWRQEGSLWVREEGQWARLGDLPGPSFCLLTHCVCLGPHPNLGTVGVWMGERPGNFPSTDPVKLPLGSWSEVSGPLGGWIPLLHLGRQPHSPCWLSLDWGLRPLSLRATSLREPLGFFVCWHCLPRCERGSESGKERTSFPETRLGLKASAEVQGKSGVNQGRGQTFSQV